MTDIGDSLRLKIVHFIIGYLKPCLEYCHGRSLMLPFIISFFNVTAAAIFVLVYLLINFSRAVAVATRAIQGHRTMKQHGNLDWSAMLADLEAGQVLDKNAKYPRWHNERLCKV